MREMTQQLHARKVRVFGATLTSAVGSGTPLVMCHQSPNSSAMFEAAYPRFARPQRVAFVQSSWHRDVVAGCWASFREEIEARGIAPSLVEKLTAEVNVAVRDPAVRSRFADLGAEPRESSPEDMARIMAADIAKWGAIIRKGGISLNQ